jgi:glucose-1-phosphate adenylyltransferase
MHDILTLILGGGVGKRLFPLTKYRSKPAVPLAGKYRLIDIPISNCINSGLNRIYILTQYNSTSLHRHVRRSYNFDPFNGGFVEILAAQQSFEQGGWYQGTADAVRQNLRYVQQPEFNRVLILSGDQLYRMNFAHMAATHEATGADVTIAALPVHRQDASRFGIIRLDDFGRAVGFLEKPADPADLELVRTDPDWIQSRGVASRGREFLASMGIYLFNKQTLVDCLTKVEYTDFGRDIFPASIRSRKVQVHLFDGYWEDIGTIKSFYQANLDLASPNPPFDLSSALAPIYSRARFLPASRIGSARIQRSLVADGCEIGNDVVIENSVIGIRSRIADGVTISNSVLMGADFYQSAEEAALDREAGRPLLEVGQGTRIENAIVDKNCRIGRNVRIQNRLRLESSEEHREYMICDQIVVVPKDTALSDGWSM